MTPRLPSRLGAFRALFAHERRQHALLLAGAVLALLALQLLIAVRAPDLPTGELPARVVFSALLLVVPLAWALLRGVWSVRREFAQATWTLLRSLPLGGGTVLFAKYAWLLTELAVLSALTLGGVFVFAGLDIGWSQVVRYEAGGRTFPVDARLVLEFAKLTLLALLVLAPLPAVALLTAVLSRRFGRGPNVLAGFAAYVLLIALGAALTDLVRTLRPSWPGLAVGSSFQGVVARGDALILPGEFIALSALFTLALLWLAGRVFEGHGE